MKNIFPVFKPSQLVKICYVCKKFVKAGMVEQYINKKGYKVTRVRHYECKG
jgi:hypothetical protein